MKKTLWLNLAAAGIALGVAGCEKKSTESDNGTVTGCYTHDCAGKNCCKGIDKDGSKHDCSGTAKFPFTEADGKALGCKEIKPQSENPTCM